MPLALGTLGLLFALIHGGLGDIDRAFGWLDRAYEGREMPLFNMLDDAIFDPLRHDPRFDELLQKIGLKLAAP